MRYPVLLLILLLTFHFNASASVILPAAKTSVVIITSKDSLSNPANIVLNADAFKSANARKLLGRKLTFKEKISLAFLRKQIKKEEKRQAEGRDPGEGAFIWGLVSLLSFIVPGAGILALPFGIVAITKGNRVLRMDPGNRKARTGVTMGIISLALFLLAFILVLIIVANLA